MKKVLYKSILIIIITFSTLGISGCWNNVTLTEQAIVVGIGLDRINDNTIEVTLQMVRPTSSNNQSQNGGSNESGSVWLNSTTGSTVFDAIRKQLETVNRKPFYSHLQIIVIGEEFARSGIGEFLDFFERDQEFRLSPNVVIAKDTTAKKILSAKSDLEDIPIIHLMEIILNDENNFVIHNVRIFDVIKNLNIPKKNPSIGVVQFKEEASEPKIGSMKVKGAGIFVKDRLVKVVEDDSVEGLNYILDKSKNGIIKINDPLTEDKLVSIEQKISKTKIDLNIEKGQLKYIININAEGTIGGQQYEEDLSTKEILKTLEKETEDSIERKVQSIIDIAKNEYKSDVFGFGEKLHKQYPEYWKNVENSWEEEFHDSLVEINVEFKIVNSSLINEGNDIK